MKNLFKAQGFDTIIGKGLVVNGEMILNGTCVIEGTFNGYGIRSDQNAQFAAHSALVVNGNVNVTDVVISDELMITGNVTACTVRVEGTLAIKSGGMLKATTIYYRTLVAEPDAAIIGELRHLDYSSDPQLSGFE